MKLKWKKNVQISAQSESECDKKVKQIVAPGHLVFRRKVTQILKHNRGRLQIRTINLNWNRTPNFRMITESFKKMVSVLL